MKGGDDRDLDFGRDAEQPERQALRLIEVGVGRAVAPMRLAIGADEPEAARAGRERTEIDAGAMRPRRHPAGARLRINVALIGERQPLILPSRGPPAGAPPPGTAGGPAVRGDADRARPG